MRCRRIAPPSGTLLRFGSCRAPETARAEIGVFAAHSTILLVKIFVPTSRRATISFIPVADTSWSEIVAIKKRPTRGGLFRSHPFCNTSLKPLQKSIWVFERRNSAHEPDSSGREQGLAVVGYAVPKRGHFEQQVSPESVRRMAGTPALCLLPPETNRQVSVSTSLTLSSPSETWSFRGTTPPNSPSATRA